jgi:hypothetical protein
VVLPLKPVLLKACELPKVVLVPTTVYPETKEVLPAVGTAVPDAGAVGAVFVVLLNNTYPVAVLAPLVNVTFVVVAEEVTPLNAPNDTVPLGAVQDAGHVLLKLDMVATNVANAPRFAVP